MGSEEASLKLSRNNPVIRLTRWAISQKGLARILPSVIRLGGWLLLAAYQLIGIRVLLLTTIGRKTGQARTAPVMYVKQGQDLIVSAHFGGSGRHPQWYLNLKEHPRVTVELFWRRRAYEAVEVAAAEKEALLSRFPLGLVEALQEYTSRAFPVVRLRPTGAK